jgi:uncharacterized protein YggT (Ycf19 family)
MTDHERTTRETITAEPGAGVRTTESRVTTGGPGGVTTIARLVTFIFGVLQVALILRIILLLLVANAGNDVVRIILDVTNPFVEPFRGMFALDRVTADRSVFDIAAVVALIGWTLVELLVLALLRVFDRRSADSV